MSFYASIHGSIQYARQVDFEAAVRFLRENGWLDEEDNLVDEAGDRCTEEVPTVDREQRSLYLPRSYYRNLAWELARLFQGGSGKVVWTSTDGCFDGGVIVDGNEATYDLGAWDSSQNGERAPNPDVDFDEYCEWQADVEEAFFDRFSS